MSYQTDLLGARLLDLGLLDCPNETAPLPAFPNIYNILVQHRGQLIR